MSPCSELQLGPGASIEVTGTAAGFDAVGTASGPIRLVAQQAGTPWGAVDVTAPSVANLAYVTISGGGTGAHASAPRGGASLTGYSTGTARPVVLKLQHVVISGSAGLGLFLQQARFDPASVNLTVTGAGWYPVYLGAASAGDLPSGGMYTGNAIDQILLQTFNVAAYDDSAVLTSDVTLRNLGVPYRVGTTPSSIEVGDGVGGHPSASLTLAAGVHMLFTPQGTGGTSRILVNGQDNAGTYSAQGALVIQGTQASPVFLDSAADPRHRPPATGRGSISPPWSIPERRSPTRTSCMPAEPVLPSASAARRPLRTMARPRVRSWSSSSQRRRRFSPIRTSSRRRAASTVAGRRPTSISCRPTSSSGSRAVPRRASRTRAASAPLAPRRLEAETALRRRWLVLLNAPRRSS